MIKGGYLTAHDGTDGKSIYEGEFDDESFSFFKIQHNKQEYKLFFNKLIYISAHFKYNLFFNNLLLYRKICSRINFFILYLISS